MLHKRDHLKIVYSNFRDLGVRGLGVRGTGEALFEENDCERQRKEDMRPIDEDMTPEVLARHDEAPNKDDTGIRQCPIATPIPEKSR